MIALSPLMAFVLYYRRLAILTLLNLLTVALSLPLIALIALLAASVGQIGVAPVGFVVVLGVLSNPLAVGMQWCSRLAVIDEPIGLWAWREGFRSYGAAAARVFTTGVLLLLMILANVYFYATIGGTSGRLLQIVWLYVLLMWVSVHLYAYPLVFAVDRPSVLLIYRNALVLCIRRPMTTALSGGLWLAWLVFCSVTGLFVIGGLAIAAGMQQIILSRLLSSVAARSG